MVRETVTCIGFVGFTNAAASTVNQILKSHVFASDEEERSQLASRSPGDWGDVQVHVPPEADSIFLFLDATADQFSSGGNSTSTTAGATDDSQYRLMQRLLLMFLTCHIVIFIHQGTTFDFASLRILRSLQLGRQQLGPALQSNTGSGPSCLNPSYAAPGQLLPVLSYLFVDSEATPSSPHLLDSQIRILLRRSRLTGMDSHRTPLCNLDATTVAFVVREHLPPQSDLSHFSTLLLEGVMDGGRSPASDIDETGLQAVRDFIAKQGTFLRRQGIKLGPRYELPTAQSWLRQVTIVNRLIRTGQTWPESSEKDAWRASHRSSPSPSQDPPFEPLERLRASLNPSLRFSHFRCSHGHSLAKAQYVAGLSTADVDELEDIHRQLMASALELYAMHCLGDQSPAFQKRLVRDCEAVLGHRRGQLQRNAQSRNEEHKTAATPSRFPTHPKKSPMGEEEDNYLFDTLANSLNLRRQPSPHSKPVTSGHLSGGSDTASEVASNEAADVGSNPAVEVEVKEVDAPTSEPADNSAAHPFIRPHALCHCGRSIVPHSSSPDTAAVPGGHSLLGPHCCGVTYMEVSWVPVVGGHSGMQHGRRTSSEEQGSSAASIFICCLSRADDWAGPGGRPFFRGNDQLHSILLNISPEGLPTWAIPPDVKTAPRLKTPTSSTSESMSSPVGPQHCPPILQPHEFALSSVLEPSNASNPKPTSPQQPTSKKSEESSREGGKAVRRRRKQEIWEEPREMTSPVVTQSHTLLMGFEYENASDGCRWMVEPSEVLLGWNTVDEWPGVPMFLPERKIGGRHTPSKSPAALRVAILHRLYIIAPNSDVMFSMKPIMQYYDSTMYTSGPASLEMRTGSKGDAQHTGLLPHLTVDVDIALPAGHVVVICFPYVFPGVDYHTMRLDDLGHFRLKQDFVRPTGGWASH